MKALIIVLTVIYVISVIYSQVTYHLADNSYGYPNPCYYNDAQRISFYVSIGVTYAIALFGWIIQMSYFTKEMDTLVLRPLSWVLFISGILVILPDLGRSEHEDLIPGIFLATCNIATSAVAIWC